MVLRWMLSVPPPMRDAHWPKNSFCQRPWSGALSPWSIPAAPFMAITKSPVSPKCSEMASFKVELSGPGCSPRLAAVRTRYPWYFMISMRM